MKYVEGICRNSPDSVRSHLYEETSTPKDISALCHLGARTGYLPMCRWGWNRSDGESFSIFRGHTSRRGTCGICIRRAREGKHGVEAKPNSHKTKWI